MQKLNGLVGLIKGQCRTQEEFATKIHWSRQKLSAILTGRRMPSIADVEDIADGLGVPFQLIIPYFLTKKSTNE